MSCVAINIFKTTYNYILQNTKNEVISLLRLACSDNFFSSMRKGLSAYKSIYAEERKGSCELYLKERKTR